MIAAVFFFCVCVAVAICVARLSSFFFLSLRNAELITTYRRSFCGALSVPRIVRHFTVVSLVHLQLGGFYTQLLSLRLQKFANTWGKKKEVPRRVVGVARSE